MRLNPIMKLSLGMAAVGLPTHPIEEIPEPSLKDLRFRDPELILPTPEDIRKLAAAEAKRQRKAERKVKQ
jgi:hypothetical protein